MMYVIGLLFYILLALVPGITVAQAADCTQIRDLTTRGVLPENEILKASGAPFECIVPDIKASRSTLLDTTLDLDSVELRGYIANTAAAIKLVENDFDQVTAFRLEDDIQTIHVLAEGTRHPERAVRLNSARLLANVVDNSTLCIILDHLAASVNNEVPNDVTLIGRANLLGVAKAAAKWIGMENQNALSVSIDAISADVKSAEAMPNSPQKGKLENTKRLVGEIQQRINDNESVKVSPTSLLESCKYSSTYRFWKSNNPYIQDDDSN